jgi:hypothetical protein
MPGANPSTAAFTCVQLHTGVVVDEVYEVKENIFCPKRQILFVRFTKMGKNIPIDHKIYQTIIKYTKQLQNAPNDHNVRIRAFSIPSPSKNTLIGMFGMRQP